MPQEAAEAPPEAPQPSGQPRAVLEPSEPERKTGASLPGRPFKKAGLVCLIGGGAAVIAGIYATKIAYEQDPFAGESTNVHVYLLSGGFVAMLSGALLYRHGKNADNRALMPGYAAPLITSDELGIVFGGAF